MARPYDDCRFCGGEVTEKKVEVDYRWKSQLIVIKNALAGVCNQCGEKYFKAEVAEEMEKLAKESGNAKHTIKVPVQEFHLTKAV